MLYLLAIWCLIAGIFRILYYMITPLNKMPNENIITQRRQYDKASTQ